MVISTSTELPGVDYGSYTSQRDPGASYAAEGSLAAARNGHIGYHGLSRSWGGYVALLTSEDPWPV